MTFRDLHYGDQPLLLPNAWDAGSALAFAAAGFPAVGTTSFGVNASAGRPDAGSASRDATAALVRRIAALGVHVTADIEDGYSDDPAEVAAFVAGLAADILEDEGQRDRIEHTAELLLKLTSLSDKEVDDLLAEKIGSIEEGNAQ